MLDTARGGGEVMVGGWGTLMTLIFMIFTDVFGMYDVMMYDVMMYDVERHPDDRMPAHR